ncbi:MAG: hypothetical protein K6T63_12775 [Alicyclobacillus herbarius]|uniref:hypothetical protein n=1 Tax=Alicyclobacillus herbarius TaxID=122960 RepID=UPI00235652F6|nr:hypothetical protein [Alicyclobacillus herbarius]MCL6633491.1 hypothetical protein [Alicyclobacillus herbarius]
MTRRQVKRGSIRAVLGGAALLMGLSIFVHHPWQRLPAEATADEHPPSVCRLAPTHLVWRGRPVYRLWNPSPHPLHHIALNSLSEEPLVLLAITPTANPPRFCDPLANPPYTLPAGGSLWFVGPKPPPLKIIVHWQDTEGRIHHEFDASETNGVH